MYYLDSNWPLLFMPLSRILCFATSSYIRGLVITKAPVLIAEGRVTINKAARW
jgi:hypothetical protein